MALWPHDGAHPHRGFGRDHADCPSSFLLWILESYENCEHSLRQACRDELSHRLGLDFDNIGEDKEEEIKTLQNKIKTLDQRIIHYEKILCMPNLNKIRIEQYLREPKMLDWQIELMREVASIREDVSTIEQNTRRIDFLGGPG